MRTSRPRAYLPAFVLYSLLAAAAGALLYFAGAPFAATPDGLFHLHRTRALADALAAGVAYPRTFPDFAFGYGYPVLHYYAPLSYYPAALLDWAGAGLVPAVTVGLALFLAFSAVAMYLFLQRWTAAYIAFAVTTLSMVAPYRLYNLSVRGALPEYAAYAWLPLMALAIAGLAQVQPDDGTAPVERPGGSRDVLWFVLLAVASCGLVLTHNLSALLVLLTLSAVSLVVIAFGVERRAVLRVAVPALLGIGLAGFYFLPALAELEWVGIGQSSGRTGYLNHMSSVTALFSWSFPYAYPSAADPTVPVPGPVLVVNAGMVILAVAGREARLRLAALTSLLISTGALLMMAQLSAPIWNLGSPVLATLQFPWRWQAIVTFSALWGVALILEWLRTLLGRGRDPLLYALIAVGVAAFVYYALAGLPRRFEPIPAESLTIEGMWDFDAAQGQVGATWTGEFLPRWVEAERWAIGRPPPDTSGVIQAGAEAGVEAVRPVRAGYLETAYAVGTSMPSRLIFHAFYFPAWRIAIDGRRAQTSPAGELGLLAVDVPAGEHEMVVRWSPTAWVLAGWTVTAAAWLLVLTFVIRSRTRPRTLVYVWLALGVLPALLWLWPARMATPAQVGADYGSVRLEAASVRSARTGTNAEVDLTWYIAQPQEPLTAFVHVAADDDRVLAQDDGPLAGTYTPFERWLPGMIVSRRHSVPLPADLPAGTYRVLAGVYPSQAPGEALAPLENSSADLDTDEHGRITVGVLEVED